MDFMALPENPTHGLRPQATDLRRFSIIMIVLGACCFAPGTRAAETLAPMFVHLADVDASIRQDMRYAGAHNFVGRPVAGYDAPDCVVTEPAARALARAQAELRARKLSFVVWDCYRPARAVADFLRWSKSPSDAVMKTEFYPRTDKAQLFTLGYLATRSAHSRGSTVDLGIVPTGLPSIPVYAPGLPLVPCISPKGSRFEDGTIDFGTGYDCLDVLASSDNPAAGAAAIENRRLLRALMMRTGFMPYAKEWWHFELRDEPFPQRAFDFPIVRR
jgi:D-alanyl-D-alanine dipeptidase